MNKTFTLLVIFQSCLAVAQKMPDLGFYKIRLVYDDRVIQAEINPVKHVKQIFPERLYSWYSHNSIKISRGGFSGKLLNGPYEEFNKQKKLKVQGSFYEGLKSGLWKSWDDQGNLIQMHSWRQGIKDGPFKIYDPSGKLKEEGNYRANQLHGLYTKYYGADSVELVSYKKGVVVLPKSRGILNIFKRNKPSEKTSLSSHDDTFHANPQQKDAVKANPFQSEVEGSALYIVIIISLVIALLCSALILAALFYRLDYQKKQRYETLQNNLESGVNLVLAADSADYQESKTFSLFDNRDDSVSLKVIPWGLYDIGIVKAFKQQDSLYKVFSIGYTLDSLHWAAVYLTDNQTPLYVSGKTEIIGNAYIPKAGILEVYVEGKKYEGDKRIVIGRKQTSKSTLPVLRSKKLKYLESSQRNHDKLDSVLNINSVQNSFKHPTRSYHFRNRKVILKNIRLQGNIILYSDNHIDIDSTASLENVLIFAKSIHVGQGFTGRCQLFAQDSIVTGKNCRFDYPSVMAVMNFNAANNQARIRLDTASVFNGILFSYEKKKSDMQTLIDIGPDVLVNGQVFSAGMIRFNEGASIEGSITAYTFIHEVNASLFENYLIDTKINTSKVSPYYLTSSLFGVLAKKRKVLEWLDLN